VRRFFGPAPIVVSLCDEEDARASLPTTTSDGRPIYYDGDVVTAVVTPVPKKPEYSTVQTASSEEGFTRPSDEAEPARGDEVLSPSPSSEPAYIFVTTRPPTNNDPGAISEGLWSLVEGCVVVTTLAGKHITSRALLKGEEPATVARALLREKEEPRDFQRPLSYPKLGLA
jgi:hypothetical protein